MPAAKFEFTAVVSNENNLAHNAGVPYYPPMGGDAYEREDNTGFKLRLLKLKPTGAKTVTGDVTSKRWSFQADGLTLIDAGDEPSMVGKKFKVTFEEIVDAPAA